MEIKKIFKNSVLVSESHTKHQIDREKERKKETETVSWPENFKLILPPMSSRRRVLLKVIILGDSGSFFSSSLRFLFDVIYFSVDKRFV